MCISPGEPQSIKVTCWQRESPLTQLGFFKSSASALYFWLPSQSSILCNQYLLHKQQTMYSPWTLVSLCGLVGLNVRKEPWIKFLFLALTLISCVSLRPNGAQNLAWVYVYIACASPVAFLLKQKCMFTFSRALLKIDPQRLNLCFIFIIHKMGMIIFADPSYRYVDRLN